jgi:hypothetical protein
LELLSDAVLKVDWESLPVSRNKDDDDYEDYYSYSSYRSTSTKKVPKYSEWGDEDYFSSRNQVSNSYTTDYKFVDTEFDSDVSVVTINKYTNQLTKVDFSDERLDYEMDLIEELLHTLEVEYDTMNWDGNSLELSYEHGHSTKTSRTELSEYINQLDFWKEHITTESTK